MHFKGLPPLTPNRSRTSAYTLTARHRARHFAQPWFRQSHL